MKNSREPRATSPEQTRSEIIGSAHSEEQAMAPTGHRTKGFRKLYRRKTVMPEGLPECPEHRCKLICLECLPPAEARRLAHSILGRSTSAAKQEAARANGKLGGRPHSPHHAEIVAIMQARGVTRQRAQQIWKAKQKPAVSHPPSAISATRKKP
jgi:hypothetical protein